MQCPFTLSINCLISHGEIRMTLIQFEYIVAVDNYRHFGRAAESCFVTQPTLSMQIQKFEEQLGVVIFDRNKQPVVPTDIGKRIITQARLALNEAKRVNEIVNDEKDGLNGELSIGIIPTLSPYLLPLFIHGFMEKYPKVNVRVEELLTDQVVNKLSNEQLDVGIIVTPYKEAGMTSIPLFYEHFYAYVNHREKLYNMPALRLEDIPNNELWLLNEGHCFREQVLQVCHMYGEHNGRFKYESGSLEALKKIVDKHGGLTLLPELATLDFDKSSQSRLKKFIDPQPVREVSLFIKKSFLKQKLIEALHKEILEAIPDYISIHKNGEVVKWK
ncbi:LysR substrate-binding domain-containing protein [Fulvivirga sp. M361]|uniref:hydrogen peroxide-inducible genes activator n=1 Tax=Fulvivirga sp. M361 TaxID=2594266 RepID=UPI00351BBA3D